MSTLKKFLMAIPVVGAIATLNISSPVLAANQIIVKIGDLERTISVTALEKFVKTGDTSGLPIEFSSPFFTKNVAQLKEQLQRPISIDPNSELNSKEKQFLDGLMPTGTEEERKAALTLMGEKGNGQITLDFLKVLPGDILSSENFMDSLNAYQPTPIKTPDPEPTPIPTPIKKTDNILYLSSTRNIGKGNFENYRYLIANTLDNYQDGNVFDVDFIQTQVGGNLASWLNSKPLEYYDQIWFDTTIYKTSVLNTADLSALNTWAAYKQPEFILDSSFFARTKNTNSITNSAASATINEALALKNNGGGIFIGTDHNEFAYTANQILANFGFDRFFTGSYNITANASFVGDLLLDPEPIGPDFFTNNLKGLSTSYVPVGTHILNENGGNRTIQIYEQFYSNSPNKIVHIGASFRTDEPKSVPEPSSMLGLLAFGTFGVASLLKRKQ